MYTNNDLFSSTIEQTRALREGKTAVGSTLKSSKLTAKTSAAKSTKRMTSSTAPKKVLKSNLDPVEDQVIAVVDPELDSSDLEDNLADLQAIVEDADDGEVPVVNDYVGDNVYQCSVCGNNFFSEDEIEENPVVCPVCGEETSVVLQGEVEESLTDEDEDPTEVVDETTEYEDDLPEVVDETDEDEESEFIANESLILRKSSKIPAKTSIAVAKTSTPKYSSYSFDDAKMNALLNNYLTENYSNAKSVKVTKGSIDSSTGKLTLTCSIQFKSGKSKLITLTSSAINLKSKTTSARMTESTKFLTKKATYTKSPFTLDAKIVGKTIVPTAFHYNYVVTEGLHRYQVVGNPKVILG